MLDANVALRTSLRAKLGRRATAMRKDIIDRFEIFVERLHNLTASAQTWSAIISIIIQ